jgi:hypothetical protein
MRCREYGLTLGEVDSRASDYVLESTGYQPVLFGNLPKSSFQPAAR